MINLITIMYAVCSKLCGDNLQRSTKQNGLSEQRLHKRLRHFFSSLCQRRQSSYSFLQRHSLCSHEQRIQSMVGGQSRSTNVNLQSGPHHQRPNTYKNLH